MNVTLTAADHEQNGFVALATWAFPTETAAREFIANQDALIDSDMEPDAKTAPFAFILDLESRAGDMIDNSKRLLPTQIAMALAPDQVREWLNTRPDPDSYAFRRVRVFLTPGRSEE